MLLFDCLIFFSCLILKQPWCVATIDIKETGSLKNAEQGGQEKKEDKLCRIYSLFLSFLVNFLNLVCCPPTGINQSKKNTGKHLKSKWESKDSGREIFLISLTEWEIKGLFSSAGFSSRAHARSVSSLSLWKLLLLLLILIFISWQACYFFTTLLILFFFLHACTVGL